MAVIGAVGAVVAALIQVDVSTLWTQASNVIHASV
jgi:hypothetical protein